MFLNLITRPIIDPTLPLPTGNQRILIAIAIIIFILVLAVVFTLLATAMYMGGRRRSPGIEDGVDGTDIVYSDATDTADNIYGADVNVEHGINKINAPKVADRRRKVSDLLKQLKTQQQERGDLFDCTEESSLWAPEAESEEEEDMGEDDKGGYLYM